MSHRVNIELSEDQALVLFEFFARFNSTNRLHVLNNAEFIALSEVAAQIERFLVQPLQPNYQDLLAQAQTRVAAGYEGSAPGVETA